MFQSTHPRRVRLHLSRKLNKCLLFQSTHPRRVRLEFPVSYFLIFSFNPRTHVGCDDALALHGSTLRSFNPRTHVGCDCPFPCMPQRYTMFQSTHPRRVRLGKWFYFDWFRVFQSTHPRRVRQHIQQMAEYQRAKIIILRKTAKKIRIKYHKRYIICKSLIFRRCETIDYFAIL